MQAGPHHSPYARSGKPSRSATTPLVDGYDEALLKAVVSEEFLARSNDLLDAVSDQISTSLSSRLPIQLRYQLALEFTQIQIELLSLTRTPQLSAIRNVIAKAGGTDSAGDMRSIWERLKALPEYEAQRPPLEGTRVLPLVYLSGSGRGMTSEEVTLLNRWYAPTQLHRRCVLIDQDALGQDPETAGRLYRTIESLSGHDPSTLQAVLGRCGGTLPLIRGPLMFTAREGRWWGYAKQPHLRIPYGALPSTRRFLKLLQSDIESGKLGGHTVQVAGRISKEFLNWALGRGIDDPGPIPDIEILYAFPLPSGRLYKFPVKSVRDGRFTQRTSLDRSRLSPEDAQMAAAIEHYFGDPENRRSLRLLTDLVPEHFDADLQEFAQEPWRVTSFDIYQRLRNGWWASLARQLGESFATRDQRQSRINWLDPAFSDRNHFEATVRDRLRALPDEQTVALFKAFKSFNKEVRATIRECRARVDAIEKRKGRYLQQLAAALKEQDVGRRAFGAAMNEARQSFDQRIARYHEEINLAQRHLLDFYKQFDPGGARASCQHLISIVDQHIVKVSYSVGADHRPVLDEEILGAQGVMRRTHSEQLGGRNMYAGGEMIFARWREQFSTFGKWLEYRRSSEENRRWYLVELNNMSGHYQPSPTTLPFARAIVFPVLESLGIETGRAQVVDRLAPGLRMRGVVAYRF